MKIVAVTLLAAVLPSLLLGCDSKVQESTSAASANMVFQDSPENRRALAEGIVELYPTSNFIQHDLEVRISNIVGREVGDSVRTKLRSQLGVSSIEQTRIDKLVKYFNAQELATLKSLYGSESGISLIRKMPAYDEAWKSFLTPIVTAELSGTN